MTPQEAARRLRKTLGKDFLLYAEGAIYEEGQRIMKEAIPRTPLAPVRGGSLRGSGYVTLPKRGSVTVGFGGTAAKYALFVHEMPASTNWSEPGTGNKYLEKTVNEAVPQMARRIAASITRRARSGRTRP